MVYALINARVVVRESSVRDSQRILALFLAKSCIARTGTGARMGFLRRILGENPAESGTLSARIPAHSHINFPGCMRAFTARKRAENLTNQLAWKVSDPETHHKHMSNSSKNAHNPPVLEYVISISVGNLLTRCADNYCSQIIHPSKSATYTNRISRRMSLPCSIHVYIAYIVINTRFQTFSVTGTCETEGGNPKKG
jgi:hypothetical protein